MIRFCGWDLLLAGQRAQNGITAKRKAGGDANGVGGIKRISAETTELQARNFLKKLQKSREISNFTAFYGGLEGDRTLDLCDANAALSRVRHNTGPILLAGRGFLLALFGPVYCAGFIGNANHWEEVSE